MKQVILFGIGEFAECVHYYFTNDSQYEVAAFTVDRAYIKDATFRGLPIVPFDEIEKSYPPDRYDMFIAVGYTALNSHRRQKFIEAKEKGYKLVSYICSKSTVWPDLKIGENCFIGENNTIQPFVTIENNVIIWSGNLIGHGAYISQHCFIRAHVIVAARVKVDENCFLSFNATIRDHIKVAKNCILGPNSCILSETEEDNAYLVNMTKASRVSGDMLKNIL